MNSDADKNQILESYIKNIACLADKEYQERVWVRAEGAECDDIDDTICDFFDEDYVLKKYKNFGITEIQYDLLIKLYNKLREFRNRYDVYSSEKSTQNLIALPQWAEITEIAKEVLVAFDYPKNGDSTMA